MKFTGDDLVLSHQHFIQASTITAMAQIKLKKTANEFLPEEVIAIATSFNDIFLYSVHFNVVLFTWAAHDDYITGLIYLDQKLISYSLDMTIKVWELTNPVGKDMKKLLNTVVTIYDH